MAGLINISLRLI